MKTVVLIQNRLIHYRVAFLEKLRSYLLSHSIKLIFVHGKPSGLDEIRRDQGELSWAIRCRSLYVKFIRPELIFQFVPLSLLKTDLVILQQENRILSNYFIFLVRKLMKKPVALWGHAINFQSEHPRGYREKWKIFWTKKADWFFAYTELSQSTLENMGYPKERITCVNNSIDLGRFKDELNSCRNEEIDSARTLLGLSENAFVGLFCGSLYQEKRLDFLVAAGDILVKQIPDFHLLVVGDGPERKKLEGLSKTRVWLHVLGAKLGREKALVFRLSHLMLNPGLVGLHILDAFASGLIMVTTCAAKHSPEIIYLKPEINGIVTDDDPLLFSKKVAELLREPDKMKKIKDNALAASNTYTLEEMVENFGRGILRSLK